jgi:tetratricopeptide (TPR) repeat protein
VSAAKCSSSGGGSHAEIASSAVTGDQERLSRRLLALTGLWFLLGGLLLALSLVVVALVAFALLLLVNFAIAGIWLLRRFEMREGLRALLASTGQTVRGLGRRRPPDLGVRRRGQRLGIRARKAAAGAPSRASGFLASGLRLYAIVVYWLRPRMARLVYAGAGLATSLPGTKPRPVATKRQALRLNELGAQLRRRGDHVQAAQQHRVALAIVRDLGDEQAEALTLNSLGLALAQSGAESEAVQHLEQALVVLRELGDDKHEARVIANLAMVHRRQGHSEEAVSLLHEALDRLPPESSAYRQVEEELRRAS